MADPLSATANVAAVIGLIDVVCRAGKEIYGFIAAVKNASKEIKDLQGELQGIEGILLSTRQCCKKRLDRLSTASEDSSALRSITSTLKRIEVEYATLSEIIANTNRTKNGRTRTKTTQRLVGNIAWVMNGEIRRSCERLERYKSQLCVDLLILGSFNDLTLSDKLDAIKGNVFSYDHHTKAGFQSLDRSLKDFTVATNASLQNLSYRLQADINNASQECERSSESIIESQMQIHAKLDLMTEQLMAMGRAVGGDTIAVSYGWENQKEKLQSATLPLMLLKPKLREALLQFMVRNHDRMVLSVEDATWIRSEFEDLLATCHEAAAAATRFPRRAAKSSKQKGRSIARNPELSTSPPSPLSISHNLDGRTNSEAYTSRKTSNRCLQKNTPVGNFSVRLEWEKENSTGQYRVSRLYVLFAPGRGIADSGLFVSLSRAHHGLPQPRICRHISTYAVVDSLSPLFTCVRDNDIVRLRDLLRRRIATPRDRNIDNESILSYAAVHLRVEICELLLKEGADPVNCRWDGANAIYDFSNAFWFRHSDYNIPKDTTERLLRAFAAAGCNPDASSLGGSPLHFTVSRSLAGSRIISEDEICALIEMLLRLGTDIEHRNADGLTPLLYNTAVLGWHGYVILRELLKWGANPHAVTDFAENALHLAIAFATWRLPEEESVGEDDDYLVARLIILLQAGCDPSLLDWAGHSPSDFALSSPRTWFQWCLAIEQSGVTAIDTLLEEELDATSLPTTDTEEIKDLPEETDDWETCSSDDDEESAGRGEQFCFDTDHIFFRRDCFFPWSVPPLCRDCGLHCRLEDISRRKRDAWNVFRALRASTGTYQPVDSFNDCL
ncbi:hypothetical protein VTN96DRAFT_3183 [Rasamsonia emersonii]